MKNEKDKFFTDENGERWIFLNEIPCPNKLEPGQHTFKISFEVEYELELTEIQKQHRHIFREKEACKFTKTLDKVLSGEIKDFGANHCYELEITTKPKVNIVQKELIKKVENQNFDDYTRHQRDVCLLLNEFFRNDIAYIEKHIGNELKNILLKLWQESSAENSSEREKAIQHLIRKEEKVLRKRFIKRYKREQPNDAERKKFIKDCYKQIKILKRNRQKINQQNLAFGLYAGNLNSAVKHFQRERDKFGLTVKEIEEECEEIDGILNRE